MIDNTGAAYPEVNKDILTKMDHACTCWMLHAAMARECKCDCHGTAGFIIPKPTFQIVIGTN